ncbi:MAG TPA: GDSL-type esterase/lipase family protein [Chthoniobacteraceae bacterium]|jgi:lysophospholipase L1-like esterase
MFKAHLSLLAAVFFTAAAHAQLPAPIITRDADGLVTISPVPGAVVYYTINGNPPDKMSGVYLRPFQLPYKATVSARAVAESPAVSVPFDALGNAPTPPRSAIPITQNRNWAMYDWQERHNAICKDVRERQPALILIGDSITHLMSKPIWEKYYAPLNAANLGFGWDRTENVIWRLQNGELDGYRPKVAVLLIGTNNLEGDSAEVIATGVRAICSEINNRTPTTKILLLGIFPRGEKPGGLRTKVEETNKLLSGFDGKNGIMFLDIGAKFLNTDGAISREIMGDFLHPSAKGYEIWAEAMNPTLQKLLGE